MLRRFGDICSLPYMKPYFIMDLYVNNATIDASEDVCIEIVGIDYCCSLKFRVFFEFNRIVIKIYFIIEKNIKKSFKTMIFKTKF